MYRQVFHLPEEQCKTYEVSAGEMKWLAKSCGTEYGLALSYFIIVVEVLVVTTISVTHLVTPTNHRHLATTSSSRCSPT